MVGIPIIKYSLMAVTLSYHSLVNDLKTLCTKFALSKVLPRSINWLVIIVNLCIKSLVDSFFSILNITYWETNTRTLEALTCVVLIWATSKVPYTSFVVVQLEILSYSLGVRELVIIHLTLKVRRCFFLSSSI